MWRPRRIAVIARPRHDDRHAVETYVRFTASPLDLPSQIHRRAKGGLGLEVVADETSILGDMPDAAAPGAGDVDETIRSAERLPIERFFRGALSVGRRAKYRRANVQLTDRVHKRLGIVRSLAEILIVSAKARGGETFSD